MGSRPSFQRRPMVLREGEVWERDINNNLTGRKVPRPQEPRRLATVVKKPSDLPDEIPGGFKRAKLCKCENIWTDFKCGMCQMSFHESSIKHGEKKRLPSKGKKEPSPCVTVVYPSCPFCKAPSSKIEAVREGI
ncbi:hypothetical protein KR067_011776 [Drosophila pandora]|nr:hypothetical protein KR067_011776 [Drosophila pandora]